MDYKAIMEIMDQELDNQPMASEETRNTYSALNEAIENYVYATQKDAFYFGYITGMRRMEGGNK